MMHKRYSITKKWKPTDRGDDERLVVISPDEVIPSMDRLLKSPEMLPTRSDSIDEKPVKQFSCAVYSMSFLQWTDMKNSILSVGEYFDDHDIMHEAQLNVSPQSMVDMVDMEHASFGYPINDYFIE